MTVPLFILLIVMVVMGVIAYAEIQRESRPNVREMPNVKDKAFQHKKTA
jgi:multidrug efflux pump subunit AcrB